MSATRDKSQNSAFVFTSLYQVYRQAKEGGVAPGLTRSSGSVLKVGDWQGVDSAPVQKSVPNVAAFHAPELLGKRLASKAEARAREVAAAPVRPAACATPQSPVDELKKNLAHLQELHSRLRFMLQELEDLVK